MAGVLDRAAAPRIWTAVTKCLVERPQAVVVDLSGVRVRRSGLGVFGSLARQATRWPGIPLVLVAPAPDVAAAFDRLHFRDLQVVGGVDAAAERIGLGSAVPVLIENLLPVSGAGRHARDVVTAACLRWDLAAAVGPACILATELVNNAVQHAATMLELMVALRARHLHVAVRDGVPDRPPVLTPGAGMGLRLVDGVAVAWGHLASVDSKVVWATLRR